MVGTLVHQLTRTLTDDQLKDGGFAPYFVDHTAGVYPTAASGFPWSAASMQVKGDPIADLTEDLAAEQKARVTYDGIVSTSIPFKVGEWYYKYFNVNVDDVETEIKNGNLVFTFNISADKLPGEEDYPCSVNVKAGRLPVKLNKLSETQYRCNVTGLRQGENQVFIQLQEPGCPVSVYPFSVSYTKPAAKQASGAKENVVIKNNSKPKRQAPPQPVKKPRLEI